MNPFSNPTRIDCSNDRPTAFNSANSKLARTLVVLAVWFFLVAVFTLPLQAQVENDSADSFLRPWESRPYKVQVWICSNRSPEIASVLPGISSEIMRRAELVDPSAWIVEVGQAPGQWRTRLLELIGKTEEIDGLAESDVVSKLDKLVAVCLTHVDGAIRYQVREFDVQTEQWGAMLDRSCPQCRDLASPLITAIERVFMPLARIDRVSKTGEVFVRARAINACLQSDVHDGSVTAIENSPVWVRLEDRFLPIIRRVDRNGDLAGLAAVPFTFLTVESQVGPRLVCKIHSRQRAALGGRSSKRAQKLALVIRPPESSTRLKLVSRDDNQSPLSGYEIFSRRPEATRDEESVFLGLTDWRGMIEIPPFEEGLRLVYVKRGSRPLMKLPIIPGLYAEVVTPVPDDEARLSAEGIARGFQIEILNLVAQRELFQAQIKSALEKRQVESAKSFLEQFQQLESPSNLKIRIANEESRLKNSTFNKRELDRIVKMFQQLHSIVSNNMSGSIESKLQSAIQTAESRPASSTSQ